MYAREVPPDTPFYHGTKADLVVGDLLALGHGSNFREQELAHIYFSATLEAATWGAELARGRDGQEGARGRIYIVEPDRRMARRPQPHRPEKNRAAMPGAWRALQSGQRHRLLPLGRAAARGRRGRRLAPHSAEQLAQMKASLARMEAEGGAHIID